MNIRQRKSERHKDTLRKLSQNGGNKSCFDCGMRGPLYVVSDFGILVCSGCSAVHRSFQHKVKGITMSEFTDEEIARFSVSGNDRARKVWLSTFRDQLPRSGDVMALKSHVRVVFEERRYWDAQEFSALEKSWENPNEQSVQVLAAKAESRPAASSLPPAPEARTALTGSVSAAATPAPPSWAAPPPSTCAPTPPARPPQDDVFDSLFAAPVQSPQMPQSTEHSAAAAAPPMAASLDPAHPPATVASLVGELFAGVPPPAVQPAGGRGVFYPHEPQQQQSMDCHTGGTMYNFTQGPPSSMAAPPQLQSLQLPCQQPQQQQPSLYTASNPMGCTPFEGNQQASTFNFARPPAPVVNANQQQQPFTWGQPAPAQLQQSQQSIMGMFGTSGPAAPYSAPTQAQGYNFNSGAPSTNAYPSAMGAAPQAFHSSLYTNNPPPPPQEGWGAPSSSNASPSPNRNRIVVLSMTKQQNDKAKNSQSQWP